MDGASIIFPHLGITIEHLGKSISVFGFEIAYYGLIIGVGMILGISVICAEAKRMGENSDLYFDFCLTAIITAIIGARIYYVAFEWDYYSQHPDQIINLRGGGLAIYGGIIAGTICMVIFSKVKKLRLPLVADATALGLVLGQIIGRWGNFCNREAFGGYTDGLFAMQIRLDEAAYTTPELMEHLVDIGGVSYIQVQPTFLYESMWNLGVLIFLLLYRKHKKFAGEVFLLYLFLYGIGRFIIEGFRTDQLLLPVIGFPVSKALSALIVICAFVLIMRGRTKAKN